MRPLDDKAAPRARLPSQLRRQLAKPVTRFALRLVHRACEAGVPFAATLDAGVPRAQRTVYFCAVSRKLWARLPVERSVAVYVRAVCELRDGLALQGEGLQGVAGDGVGRRAVVEERETEGGVERLRAFGARDGNTLCFKRGDSDEAGGAGTAETVSAVRRGEAGGDGSGVQTDGTVK